MRRIETEVLVVGGGATGTGIIRDLAMRGFDALLVERDDWASGTTGRYNGLMHSGSRYALMDLQTGKECIQENRILRKIMPHCIEDTSGLMIATPGDDPVFGNEVIDRCRQAGIPGNAHTFFLEKAGVALNDGAAFGRGGEGFVRLNFGCPRSTLVAALDRIRSALLDLA